MEQNLSMRQFELGEIKIDSIEKVLASRYSIIAFQMETQKWLISKEQYSTTIFGKSF